MDVTTISPIKPNDGIDHADDLQTLLFQREQEPLWVHLGGQDLDVLVQSEP